jgi:hypothetical protein
MKRTSKNSNGGYCNIYRYSHKANAEVIHSVMVSGAVAEIVAVHRQIYKVLFKNISFVYCQKDKIYFKNNIKNKQHHTIGAVPKSNGKITGRGKFRHTKACHFPGLFLLN